MDSGIITQILQRNFVPSEEATHGYIILVDDKIFVSTYGVFLFRTRQEALKSFYTTLRWRVCRFAGASDRGDEIISDEVPTWSNQAWNNRARYWREFKEALKDRMKIVQI